MAYLTTLEARLDAVYSALETLGPDSLAEDFVNFASFFSEDCIAYLRERGLYTPSNFTVAVATLFGLHSKLLERALTKI
ncbi:hypothetical protein FG05_13260 [Fusarium graminearum]|nr:hypothetical protein FG05_13260 [Fusarium graminearum]